MIREEAIVLGGPSSVALVLTIARPEKKNAISREIAEALADAVEQAGDDDAVRAIILAADGDVFAAGGDLDEIAADLDDGGADNVLAIGERLRAIETCPVPVIVALTGDVYGGGCELVLLADVIVAEEQARLSFRHARMGLAPAWGGSSALLARTSAGFAARVLFTAEAIDARAAERAGLVTEVVPTGKALERCVRLAGEIASAPRDGVAGVKASLYAARRLAGDDARTGEANVFRALFGGAAHRAVMHTLRRR